MPRRIFALVAAGLLLAGSIGCSVCQSTYDYNYGFYGGSWQRHDPACGRVGSVLQPAGAPVYGPSQAEIIAPPDQPLPSQDFEEEELPPRRSYEEGPEVSMPVLPERSPLPGRSPRPRTNQRDYLP
jgi:hypothetical protein